MVDAITQATTLGMVGLTPIDFFPFREFMYSCTCDDTANYSTSLVRHIPPWLPGATLIRKARDAKILVDKMIDEPFERSWEEKVDPYFCAFPLFSANKST